MQDYGLGLRVGLKDLPTLRKRIHCPILTELKTFLFYHGTFLTGGTDASRARLRDLLFVALCSSSVRKPMSVKATATPTSDWKDPEAADQAPGPHAISAPIQVPPSPPHDPHMLPPGGFKAPWKGKDGREPEIKLPKQAYKDDAEPPTEYCWAHPDGMWLLRHFNLVVRFMSFSCNMGAFPCILPILCVAEEDEIAFHGAQPWHINWYDGLDEQERHQLQHQAQRKEEGEEAQEGMKTDEDEDPWNLAWREEPQPEPHDAYPQWQKEIEIEHLADIIATPSPSPTSPGTPKHSPQLRTEAERGMHRYAPLHHGTCYLVPFLHRQPCLQQQWSRGRWTWRRDAIRWSQAPRVQPTPRRWVRHQTSEVSPWWRHLFACPFCVNCAFFLVSPFFLPHMVHLLVGLFREKGCGGAPSEDEGAPGSQGP